MQAHIIHKVSGFVLFRLLNPGCRVYVLIVIATFSFVKDRVLGSEPGDVERRLIRMCETKQDDWVTKEAAEAQAKTKATFIADNRAAILAYVERRVDEVQRPEQYNREALQLLSSMCRFAAETDKVKGLALCLRLLRSMDRTLLVLEEFLYGKRVDCWALFGKDAMAFIAGIHEVRVDVLRILGYHSSSLAVPEAKRYLTQSWSNNGIDMKALDYLLIIAKDSLEVRVWLDAQARDTNSTLNRRSVLADVFKRGKSW